MQISNANTNWNNPAGVLGGGSYLVDDYSPKVAYGLRKLSSTATNAIRVRRTSDSTEQDIGFSGDNLNTSSLETFCSGTDGYVVTWYDQSGNSNDATQAGAANQPRIVSSGTIDTEPTNGLSAMWCTDAGSSQHFDLGTPFATTQLHYNTMIFTRTAGKYNGSIKNTANGVFGFYWFTSNTIYIQLGTTLTAHDTSQTQTGTQLVTVLRDSSDNVKYWLNNSAGTTKTAANKVSTWGTLLESGGDFYGHVQEIIVWDDDQESNRTDIQDNMNGYYSVY